MTTQAERLASVEVEVRELKREFDEHKQDTKDEFEKVNSKLDDLLAIKHKGMGAFWLASALVGTGIIGFFWQVINWFTGK